MDILTIPPTTLTIVSTYRCTAACTDCCFGCTPKRKEMLSLSEIIEIIDKCLSVYESIKVIVITGGECFLYSNDLTNIISYIKNKKRFSRIVTNGYWASSYPKALKTITTLRNAGLDEINFSTGDDHTEFVPIKKVYNGIQAALSSNLSVALNIETGRGRKLTLSELLHSERFRDFLSPKAYKKPLQVVQGQWMPFTQETLQDMLQDKESHISPASIGRCKNLFNSLTVTPTKHLCACCGLPSTSIPFLDLGVMNNGNNITQLYESQFDDFLKIWLYVEGPYKMLSFISSKGYEVLETKYNFHMCFYCACIFSNQLYLNILKAHYKEVYISIMLKYFFIKKRLNYAYA